LQDGTAAQTVVPVSNVHSLVMGFSTSVNAFQTHAIVDEYRLSSVARSADWIITEYNNQNSPSTFSTLGPENGGGFNKAHSSAFLVF